MIITNLNTQGAKVSLGCRSWGQSAVPEQGLRNEEGLGAPILQELRLL